MNTKNPIVAKNFTSGYAETRRSELQKARQNYQQNSFKVGSPEIIYYQQVRNGNVCTCHAIEKPVEVSDHLVTVSDSVKNYSDKMSAPTEVRFSTVSKTPMFGMAQLSDEDDDEDKLLDDTETPGNPLFQNLFHKGTDCGICFRTGYTPLLAPMGRQFYALTNHNATDLHHYRLDTVRQPAVFTSANIAGAYVEWQIKVPKYFKNVSVAIFNNVLHLDKEDLWATDGQVVDYARFDHARGKTLFVQVRNIDFTHVFLEFDLGIEIHANFPQFSISKDYSYFFNLQQVTIELPPTVSNPQVNDLIYVPEWDRVWMCFDVQPKYDSPLQQVLLGTAIQGRLVQSVETARIITHLKTLSNGKGR
jgi:hypothetical protein